MSQIILEGDDEPVAEIKPASDHSPSCRQTAAPSLLRTRSFPCTSVRRRPRRAAVDLGFAPPPLWHSPVCGTVSRRLPTVPPGPTGGLHFQAAASCHVFRIGRSGAWHGRKTVPQPAGTPQGVQDSGPDQGDHSCGGKTPSAMSSARCRTRWAMLMPSTAIVARPTGVRPTRIGPSQRK